MENRKKFAKYADDEYITLEENTEFPKEMPIAYAVCSAECGHNCFIVDGQTQICEFCGELNFRTDVKWYDLIEESNNTETLGLNKSEFPDKIQVALAVCSKDCGFIDWVTYPSEPVCNYCNHKMKIITTRLYRIKEEK